MRIGLLEMLTPAELQKRLKANKNPNITIGIDPESLKDDIAIAEAMQGNDANATLAAIKYDLLLLEGKVQPEEEVKDNAREDKSDR